MDVELDGLAAGHADVSVVRCDIVHMLALTLFSVILGANVYS